MRESSLFSRRQLRHQIEALLDRGRDIVESGYEAGRERAADSWHDTKRYALKKAKRAERSIHQHPYQALAIAAGVGLLLGALLFSRRDD